MSLVTCDLTAVVSIRQTSQALILCSGKCQAYFHRMFQLFFFVLFTPFHKYLQFSMTLMIIEVFIQVGPRASMKRKI